ncbi:DUF421 domain-containing protein [Telluribacter sp. SYSU D00476]|uniref:DUF421 domain-containing protein n=1 Tax=Telluribacter sp. SYSU D00476 TaxID=2811430 RepID=UPI001FF0FB7D|nr:YetF domain-containing protein [Telluribacter sp. SYSU D00476]
MQKLFFDSWDSIIRSLIITILAYFILVFMLRVSGKRTLSKMNAFDFIITIALGSSLATVALSKDVALADGALVFLLLVLLQFVITWLSVRIPFVKNLITDQPKLLLYRGELLDATMKKERITVEEVYVAARKQGITDLGAIDAIVLETTGDLTVIPKVPEQHAETLQDVKNYGKAT